MTSATATISGSPFFQSATRALAVVRAGSARAPDVQTAVSRTAAAIKVRPNRLRMLADYAAMDSIDKGSAMLSWLRNRRERVKRRPQAQRLAQADAAALIRDHGAEAYSEARQRERGSVSVCKVGGLTIARGDALLSARGAADEMSNAA